MSLEDAEHDARVRIVGDHSLVTSRVLVNDPIWFNSGLKYEVNVEDGDVLFIKKNVRVDFGIQADF